MKVHLRKRRLRNKGSRKPRYSLYLDIYYAKRKRRKEFLGIYLDPNDDKTYRQEKLKLAENIKAKRMIELTNEEFGIISKEKRQIRFIDYFIAQMEKRERNTKAVWENTLKHLKKYSKGQLFIFNMDKAWLEGFINYLTSKVFLSSAKEYYSKIKTVLGEAIRDRIISHNIKGATGSIDFSSMEYAMKSVNQKLKLISTWVGKYLSQENDDFKTNEKK